MREHCISTLSRLRFAGPGTYLALLAVAADLERHRRLRDQRLLLLALRRRRRDALLREAAKQ